jgi:hypothetical protein
MNVVIKYNFSNEYYIHLISNKKDVDNLLNDKSVIYIDLIELYNVIDMLNLSVDEVEYYRSILKN